jgi:hypothetical protein
MWIIYVSIGVALVSFILYALDRRSKQENIDWFTAAKLMVFGALMSGGIVYVTQSPETVELIKTIPVPEGPVIQEMFVGTPTF